MAWKSVGVELFVYVGMRVNVVNSGELHAFVGMRWRGISMVFRGHKDVRFFQYGKCMRSDQQGTQS